MPHQTPLNPDMQRCITACTECHHVCLQMAMTHCLQLGGKHVEEEHLKLMMNCAEICQTAGNFMLTNSPLHGAVCQACAEVCNACAQSCEEVGDMDECVKACRECAETCEQMAASHPTGGKTTRKTTQATAGADRH